MHSGGKVEVPVRSCHYPRLSSSSRGQLSTILAINLDQTSKRAKGSAESAMEGRSLIQGRILSKFSSEVNQAKRRNPKERPVAIERRNDAQDRHCSTRQRHDLRRSLGQGKGGGTRDRNSPDGQREPRTSKIRRQRDCTENLDRKINQNKNDDGEHRRGARDGARGMGRGDNPSKQGTKCWSAQILSDGTAQ